MASQINSTTPQTRRPNAATKPPISRATQYVNQQLEKTRRGVKSNDVFAGLLTILVGAIAFMLLVSLWDAWISPLSTTARWLCLTTLMFGCSAYAILNLVPLLIRRINPDYAAKMIEETTPSFKNSLLNYVSLRRADATISPAVLDAVSRQAATDLSAVPSDATVDRSRLIRIGFALIGLMVLIVGYKILSPKDPLQSFGRILAPNAKIAAPAVVRISDVQPGDTQIFFGESLEVTATVRGNHQPSDVKIEFSTTDGGRTRQTIPMQATEAGDRYRGILSESGAGGSSGLGIQQSLTYRVIARDGSSPDYTVNVRPNPTIAVESLTLTPPAYTQLNEQTFAGSGAIEAVEGTEVRIEAVANLPIKVAYIELLESLTALKPTNSAANRSNTGKPEYRVIRNIEMNATDKSATTSFIALLNAARDKPFATHYQIKFVSTDDDRNQKPNVYPIRVTPDLAPDITITHPLDRDIYLPENGTLAIDIEASDLDYEIAAVKLRIDQAAASLLDANLELNSTTGNSRVTARYQLTPAKLGLRAGDKAIFFATAADNRTSPHSGQPDPNTARTENFTLNITPAEDQNEPPQNGAEQNPTEENPTEKSGSEQMPSEQPQQNPQDQQSDPQNGEQSGSDQQNDPEQNDGEQSGSEQGSDQQAGDQNQSAEQNSGEQSGSEQGSDQQAGDQNQSAEQNSGEQIGEQQNGGEQGSGESNSGESNSGESNSGQQNAEQQGGGEQGSGQQGQPDSGSQSPLGSSDPSANRNQPDNSGGSNNADGAGQRDPNLQNGEQEPLGKNASDGERFERAKEYFEQQQEQNREQNRESNGESNGEQNGESNGESNGAENSNEGAGKKPDGGQPNDRQPADENQAGENRADEMEPGEKGSGKNPDKPQTDSEQSKSGSSQSDPANRDPANSENSSGESSGEKQPDGQPSPADRSKTDEPSTSQNPSDEKNNGESTDGETPAGGKSEGQQSPSETPAGDKTDAKQSPEGASPEGNPSTDKTPADQGTGEQPADASDGDGNPEAQKSGSEESDSGEPSGQQPGDSNSTPPPEQQGESPSNSNTGEKPGKPGDDSGPGGSGSGGGELPSHQIEKETANLEHAKQATDLILEKLDQQKHEPDPKLLEELNWTESEMADFLKRWHAMKRAAESGDLRAQRKYEQSLKSLGLRPTDARRSVRQNEDTISGLNEDNVVIEPPPELAPDFNATLRDLNRSR